MIDEDNWGKEGNEGGVSKKDILEGINFDANFSFDEEGRVLRAGPNSFQSLTKIEDFIKKAINSDIKQVNLLDRVKRGRVELTALEEECLILTGPQMYEFNEKFEYSEYVKLFFETYYSFGYDPGYLRLVAQFKPGESLVLINEFLGKIKSEASGKEFKKKQKNREDGCKRNSSSLRSYIKALFAKHARILVLRVDLFYKKSIAEEVTDWASHDHLGNFLKNMRSNSLFKSMLGYIWKLEHGLEKGNHFHFAFFFDGSKAQKDAYLANQIGEYWSSKIMKGHGGFYNCNRSKNKYKRLGIGMVEYHESSKIAILMDCMDYLAKKEQYLKVKTKKGCRVFGRKIIPGRKISVGGRPRERECHLSTLVTV